MGISKDREYVLLSWKWSYNKDHLMFWGSQTQDDEERSFGGYTMDVEGCEKYTKEELVEAHHKFWRSDYAIRDLDTSESYGIKISNLHKFGRKTTIIYR